MTRWKVSAVAAATVFAMAGCAAESTGSSFDLVEFSISGPSTLREDIDAVSVSNSGEFPHTLVVTNSGGEVVAATGLIPAGASVDLGLDLEVGTFSFTCRIVAQDGEGGLIDHFESGMSTTVDVTG